MTKYDRAVEALKALAEVEGPAAIAEVVREASQAQIARAMKPMGFPRPADVQETMRARCEARRDLWTAVEWAGLAFRETCFAIEQGYKGKL